MDKTIKVNLGELQARKKLIGELLDLWIATDTNSYTATINTSARNIKKDIMYIKVWCNENLTDADAFISSIYSTINNNNFYIQN